MRLKEKRIEIREYNFFGEWVCVLWYFLSHSPGRKRGAISPSPVKWEELQGNGLESSLCPLMFRTFRYSTNAWELQKWQFGWLSPVTGGELPALPQDGAKVLKFSPGPNKLGERNPNTSSWKGFCPKESRCFLPR